MIWAVFEMVNFYGISKTWMEWEFCQAFFSLLFFRFRGNWNFVEVKGCQPAMKDGVLWKETKNTGGTRGLPYTW